MEDVCILFGHLVYFMAICYILWPFGIFYGYLVHFSRFCKLQKIVWQPCCTILDSVR
jgi:hypothetical protein